MLLQLVPAEDAHHARPVPPEQFPRERLPERSGPAGDQHACLFQFTRASSFFRRSPGQAGRRGGFFHAIDATRAGSRSSAAGDRRALEEGGGDPPPLREAQGVQLVPERVNLRPVRLQADADLGHRRPPARPGASPRPRPARAGRGGREEELLQQVDRALPVHPPNRLLARGGEGATQSRVRDQAPQRPRGAGDVARLHDEGVPSVPDRLVRARRPGDHARPAARHHLQRGPRNPLDAAHLEEDVAGGVDPPHPLHRNPAEAPVRSPRRVRLAAVVHVPDLGAEPPRGRERVGDPLRGHIGGPLDQDARAPAPRDDRIRFSEDLEVDAVGNVARLLPELRLQPLLYPARLGEELVAEAVRLPGEDPFAAPGIVEARLVALDEVAFPGDLQAPEFPRGFPPGGHARVDAAREAGERHDGDAEIREPVDPVRSPPWRRCRRRSRGARDGLRAGRRPPRRRRVAGRRSGRRSAAVSSSGLFAPPISRFSRKGAGAPWRSPRGSSSGGAPATARVSCGCGAPEPPRCGRHARGRSELEVDQVLHPPLLLEDWGDRLPPHQAEAGVDVPESVAEVARRGD